MSDAGQPLTGGRITAGVVLVAGTVRRPPSAASPFIASLLGQLAAHGFDGCPRHLGWDAEGREVLSYLPGDVPAQWRRWTDPQVAAAAQLLRGMHDAGRASAASAEGFSTAFASGYHGPEAVVCHHDPGPNNAVFRDGTPIAFIDFDFAAPGHPLEDVGYFAWSWCISSRADRGPVQAQAAQVRLAADAYRLRPADRVRLLDAVLDRQRRNVTFWSASQLASSAEVIAWTRREHAFVQAHRTIFAAALAPD
jgi:hypothetical protein